MVGDAFNSAISSGVFYVRDDTRLFHYSYVWLIRFFAPHIINITANVQTNLFFILHVLVFQIDTREYGQINSLNNKKESLHGGITNKNRKLDVPYPPPFLCFYQKKGNIN